MLKLEVELRYSVFEGNDAVIRSAVITNYGDKPLYIEKVLSACLELGYEPHDYITLHGSWARERRIDRQRVGFGCHSVESSRGYIEPSGASFYGCCIRGGNAGNR